MQCLSSVALLSSVKTLLVKLDQKVMTLLATLSCTAEEWWFYFMEDSNLEPNQVSFCALLNACAKAQNPKRAQAGIAMETGWMQRPMGILSRPNVCACASKYACTHLAHAADFTMVSREASP